MTTINELDRIIKKNNHNSKLIIIHANTISKTLVIVIFVVSTI